MLKTTLEKVHHLQSRMKRCSKICSGNAFVFFIMIIMYRKHNGPKIFADSRAEERYLSLEQLGKVLKILSQRLPGISCVLLAKIMIISCNCFANR